jgi:UDP-N-acetylglucosamine--N-acetylmuramyl-(pentapeptide) pyrophosphoryl-undecaprenol N-acetylglucosamine transferase
MQKYFPERKIVFTGNPIRKDILGFGNRTEEGSIYFNLEKSLPTILVIGGSLGAGTINKSLIKDLHKLKSFQVIWQTGKTDYEAIREGFNGAEYPNIKPLPFIKRMDLAFAVADIIISRAGAGTISELAVVGKPVILVPSPNVAEDHQTRNAMALVSKGAALHVADREAENALVDNCLALLQDDELRKRLSENLLKLAIPDAAMKIAREILET